MAVKAFREAYVTAGVIDADDFADTDSRILRYEILWSMYENTAYRDVHSWAQGYRNQYGLYKYIRNIYNPAYRLGEFWKSMIWGGLLDDEAGGEGAIPIETKNDQLREALTVLWELSNWDINKDILTLRGSILGDFAIYIRDDFERGQVRMERLHPGSLKEIDMDARGFVKGYEIEEARILDGKEVTYGEIAEREPGSDEIFYTTLLDGSPYAWNGEAAEWSEPYGFVPLVVSQHNNVGLEWGWSEMHPGRSKFMEVDDLASKLHDHLRKTVDPVWLFSGMTDPSSTPETTKSDATSDRPQPGREEIPALYSSTPDANAKALVADLDIEATYGTINGLLKELERDYPELQMDIWTAQGDASGKALRVARQRAEVKVRQRRANYDSALVRAQQMAVAIGGMRGYEGFQGFGLESYSLGALDHVIIDRPVFAQDPLDDVEMKKEMWLAVKTAVEAGASLEGVLTDMGMTDEEIQLLAGEIIPQVGQ